MSRTAQTTLEVMSATAGQDTDSMQMDVDVTVHHNLFITDRLFMFITGNAIMKSALVTSQCSHIV